MSEVEAVSIEAEFVKEHGGVAVSFGRMPDGRAAAFRTEEPSFLVSYPSYEECIHRAFAAVDFWRWAWQGSPSLKEQEEGN